MIVWLTNYQSMHILVTGKNSLSRITLPNDRLAHQLFMHLLTHLASHTHESLLKKQNEALVDVEFPDIFFELKNEAVLSKELTFLVRLRRDMSLSPSFGEGLILGALEHLCLQEIGREFQNFLEIQLQELSFEELQNQ